MTSLLKNFLWKISRDNIHQLLFPGGKTPFSNIQVYFDQDTVKAIKAIPICPKANLDKWIWLNSCHGDHTLKSAYWALQNENLSFASNTIKGNMWNTKIHERLKMHLWRIVVDILPTRTQLSKFVSNIDPICPLCELTPESSLHLFQHFPVTQSLWFGSCWGLEFQTFNSHLPNN